MTCQVQPKNTLEGHLEYARLNKYHEQTNNIQKINGKGKIEKHIRNQFKEYKISDQLT